MGLSAVMILCTAGCGNSAAKGSAEEIPELLDPVIQSVNTMPAEYRNLYNTKVYEGVVSMDITEYSYSSSQNFSAYGKLPGESVSSGDALITGNTEKKDEEIRKLQDQIAEFDESYQKKILEMQEDYKELGYKINSARDKHEIYQGSEPAYLDPATGRESAAHAKWVAESYQAMINFNLATLNKENQEIAIAKYVETYELDRAHMEDNLARLGKQKNMTNLLSRSSGNVVAVGFYDAGALISRGKAAAAVGDLDHKVILTEYISKNDLTRAKDVYAFVNGERYEVNVRELTSEEYSRIKDRDGSVYSTFEVEDPEGKLNLGDYAVVVVASDAYEHVLCVPTDAIQKDDEGTYVYTVGSAGENIRKNVSIGKKDGNFTEIVSGLEEGEKVLTDQNVREVNKTTTVEYGSVSGKFSTAGYLFYPAGEWQTSPVELGTVYLKEMCVSLNEHVTKGQVIAKLEVVPDTIEIAKRERELQRLMERFAETVKEREDCGDPPDYDEVWKATAKALDKSIQTQAEKYADKAEELEKYKKYSGVISITAPYDGIVTSIQEREDGSLVFYKDKLAMISKEDKSFVIIEDKGGALSYGNRVNITYKKDGQDIKAEGTVVTASQRALSADLRNQVALIRVDAESFAEMAGSSVTSTGYWNRNMFTVSTDTNVMNDVLVVPRKCVTTINGSTYVTQVFDDGTGKLVPFIAGGSDSANYWAVSGLTEGMKICLE